jgi:hypothetical protein
VILGAIVVWSAQYFLPSGYAALVNGGGILLLLIFLPEGIGGLLYVGRDRLLRLLARRHILSVAGIWRGAEAPGGEEVAALSPNGPGSQLGTPQPAGVLPTRPKEGGHG